jgi:hypothetical protein
MSLNKTEIPVGEEQELTDAQLHQIDVIHNAAYNAMKQALSAIDGTEPKWDMEWIGEISDCLADVAERYFGKLEMEVYPYIDNKE